MIELLLAGALFATAPQVPASAASQDPVQLEDVIVSGRTLDSLITEFVGEVAEPNRRRGLARWHDDVCVGVANLDGAAAQYLTDRISTVASDLGLSAGTPGCSPNILVIATADAEGLARQMAGQRRRAFRMGGSGMDRGGAALRDFVDTDRPVRWWQMSLPVDSETGDIAVRIPGQCTGDCTSAMQMAPQINVASASRLTTQIVDNLIRAIVIVDVDQVSDVSILQLADYIALVTLAQIDPDADTSGFASILNVFETPEIADSLTEWDLAYLDGLYDAERTQVGERAGRSEIVDSIRRAHERLRDREGEGEKPAPAN